MEVEGAVELQAAKRALTPSLFYLSHQHLHPLFHSLCMHQFELLDRDRAKIERLGRHLRGGGCDGAPY